MGWGDGSEGSCWEDGAAEPGWDAGPEGDGWASTGSERAIELTDVVTIARKESADLFMSRLLTVFRIFCQVTSN